MKNVTVIIDGQAGDSGKGKVISEFVLENKPELSIINHSPNIDHTVVLGEVKRVFKHIPVSVINDTTTLLLGPNMFIDLDLLIKEYTDLEDILNNRTIYAHPNISLITNDNIKKEKHTLQKSGSTFSGGGSALQDKIGRDDNLNFFKGYKNIKVLSHDEYYKLLQYHLINSKNILLEGSQGADLDINHSGHYPHTTSKQISVAQMFADAGISPRHLKTVVMVIRPYPIRIAPGDYGKSKEINWDLINNASYVGGYPHTESTYDNFSKEIDYTDFSELNILTGNFKRVFYLDINLLKRNVQINTPDYIYLNFFQQLDQSFGNIQGNYSDMYISRYIREYICWIERETGTPIMKLGTGAATGNYIFKNSKALEKSLKQKNNMLIR